MECKYDFDFILSRLLFQELIDTLWNVNSGVREDGEKDTGINRYIMECKYFLKSSCLTIIKWINRYIMECKCPMTP